MDRLADQAIVVLLVSLRLAPTLAFAPPFTLLRVPSTVRLIVAISLAAWLVSGTPDAIGQASAGGRPIWLLALGELMTGILLSLALQVAFAALLTIGRTIDVQAGFGLAALVDPTTRAQLPLVGTLFAYVAAAIFFTTSGPADLLAVWSESLVRLPIGTFIGGDVGRVTAYISTCFALAFGVGGLIVLALFLTDLAIAFLSRTLPQMNVLVLGFQVKTLVLLAALPASVGLSAGLIARLLRVALEAGPGLV